MSFGSVAITADHETHAMNEIIEEMEDEWDIDFDDVGIEDIGRILNAFYWYW